MKFYAVYTDNADTSIVGIRECLVKDLRGAKTVIMANRPEGAERGDIYLCMSLDASGMPVPSSVFDRCVLVSWDSRIRPAVKKLQALVNASRV